MPLLISGGDQVRRDLRSRMTLAYTVDNLLLGFRLVGDLPGGVLNLKLPTTCLISVRWQLRDRPTLVDVTSYWLAFGNKVRQMQD